MKDDVLAREFFWVSNNAGELHYYELRLIPSGGFEYGNRHALVLIRGYGSYEMFDARYDKRFSTIESFHENAYEFVRDQVSEEFEVEKAKDLYRYHLLMRPPYPGSIPINGLVNLHDEEGTSPSGHHTWGWAEYNRKLSKQEIENWELEEEK